MQILRFTGERLPASSELFALDLARHRVAYEFAAARSHGSRVLDLGTGNGSGAGLLAATGAFVVGIDRVPPDPDVTHGVRFCVGDVDKPPFREGFFDTVVSFQVVEHLLDPRSFLVSIGRLLAPGGVAFLSTPNRGRSDGVNPHHVREYALEELRDLLDRHFSEVELLGVGTSPRARHQLEARSRRIRLALRLDPLGIRRALPVSFVHRAFGWGAQWVRHCEKDAASSISTADFPIGDADEERSLDWLAVCRKPRHRSTTTTSLSSCSLARRI